MAGGGGEKTEKATPKRKREERKKGNVFSSADLVSAFFILIMFFSIKAMSKFIYHTLYSCMQKWLSYCDGSYILSDEKLIPLVIEVCKIFAVTALPILLIGILINVLFTGAQTRFVFSGDAVKFKMNRLSPISGFKKMFSIRSVVELIKSLLKIAVIGAIIYNDISKRMTDIAKLFDVDIMQGLLYMCSAIFSIAMSIGAVFIGLGVVDLGYQWWEHEKNMKMTKQEVKEEYKQMEGDPQIKGQIKQKQREMAQQRMMQDVPGADVVVRNPTHYAVAIKYEAGKNIAPKVVAKGVDLIAAKIVEIAEENKVTMTENVPLARALYAAVDVGEEIPEEFYQEVAEILAWVYDLKKKPIQ
ncbi:MAG: flagellar biosynthesis protein FlhB [Oscillospiraceae bacterium]